MRYFLFVYFILTGLIGAYAQEIPKGANIIIVKGVTFRETVNMLLDSSYTINKIDSNFQTVETMPKLVYRYSPQTKLILKIRMKDSAAYVTSFLELEKSKNLEREV